MIPGKPINSITGITVQEVDGSPLGNCVTLVFPNGSVGIADRVATITIASFDGVYSSLTGIPSTFTPAAHNHSATEITSGTLPVARLSFTKAELNSAVSDGDVLFVGDGVASIKIANGSPTNNTLSFVGAADGVGEGAHRVSYGWGFGRSDQNATVIRLNFINQGVTAPAVTLASNQSFGIASGDAETTGADILLLRNATGPAWKIQAAGGLNVKNLADSADAPITCSNLTATGTITSSAANSVVASTSNSSSGAASFSATNNANVVCQFGVWGSTRSAFGGIDPSNAFIYGDNPFVITSLTSIKFCTGTGIPERLRLHSTGGLSYGSTTDPGAGVVAITGNLTATGTVRIGGGTAIAKVLSATATLDFPSIASNDTHTLTLTVTGAVAGETVIIAVPAGLDTGLVWCASVEAADTITIKMHNSSGGSINPASGTFRATIIRF